MEIQPLFDRVLIKRLPKEEVSQGGIVMTSHTAEKQLKAEVLAVGEGRRNQDGTLTPLTVKPGDLILVSEYCSETKLPGEKERTIVCEADILCKIKLS